MKLEVVGGVPNAVLGIIADWQKFYFEAFGMECDFSNVTIPVQPAGFERLIIVAQGITAEHAYNQCKQEFACWKYTNNSLDDAVPTNDRDSSQGAYAIWVRERVEADEEHKNKSANDLAKAKINGVTLLERLVYELKFFKETGKHLDIANVTLCSGSRRSDGNVPRVYWCVVRLCVDWCYPGDAHDDLRTREVRS